MKNNFGLIISNTLRSLVYLRKIKKNNLKPSYIIYLNDNSKNIYEKKLNKENFFFKDVNVKSFLSKKITKKIANFIIKKKVEYVIFSGYAGDVIKNSNLLKKIKIIHSHPGKLPLYKGSTTIYYSLLQKGKIFCSTFILNEKIDSGKIIRVREYPIPKKITSIDNIYDAEIRATNLCEVLKNKLNLNLNLNKTSSKPYYVIHPLLRSIVFKKFKNIFLDN
tara:strand:- start:2270 stop:2929 length:660 start_codon:yes stop_codon:yes gene_type:complete